MRPCLLALPTAPSTALPCCMSDPCRKPKGFGFIEFRDTRDAEDALYALDRTTYGGREISVRPV